MTTERQTLDLGDAEMVRAVLGVADANLRALREALALAVSVRESRLTLEGEPAAVRRAAAAVGQLMELVAAGAAPTPADVRRLAGDERPAQSAPPGGGSFLRVFGPNRFVRARTPGQARYLEAMESADIVFASGPAGTGKTYLAVGKACAELAAGKVRRIVLTRPAVEAGEKLGFLPGDLREKVNPYLRPLYDALAEMIPERDLERHFETGAVEVAPLAYMRGRTLNAAYVILDEAQNTTIAQMKMFLTRLGASSRAAVVGDVTQSDLPPGEPAGMLHAISLLRGIAGLAFIALSVEDVVRHRLVRDIVRAYEGPGGGGEAPGAPEKEAEHGPGG